MNEKIILEIVAQTGIARKHVETVLGLLAEGNTVHFLARYRKEQIGGMDEEQIRAIEKFYAYEVQLQARKDVVSTRIADQGMLTPELQAAIAQCEKLVQLEQIYEPYKSKKVTKAKAAIDGGLAPLSQEILAFTEQKLESLATPYVNEHFATVAEVLENVGYLLAQMMSENIDLRSALKRHHYKVGKITATLRRGGEAKDAEKVFSQYYDFASDIGRVANHQILAMNRAEKLKIVNIKLVVDPIKVSNYVASVYLPVNGHAYQEFFTEVIEDALKRLILPSISREVRAELSGNAETEAIILFGQNVQQLLMQQPLEKQVILGFDPAFRTGCKLAVLDPQGALLEIAVIYPHAPQNKPDAAEQVLDTLFAKYGFTIIAIGNGTASRESETFVGEWIRRKQYNIAYTLVSEAGASVYSASEVAIREFPELSVEQRSAISIARRILDPLSELIKIDPKALGVGQYQHDLSQTQLNDELGFVVDKSVNTVGVDLNSASAELLTFVSGVTKKTAEHIVAHRNETGKFSSRVGLKKVKGFGPKAFEQAAGFLRIPHAKNALDNSAIHPESYKVAEAVLIALGVTKDAIGTALIHERIAEVAASLDPIALGTDMYTLDAILEAFNNPQRDERENYSAPLLRTDVLSIDDVLPGMELEGVVRNITDFGAFIDIGLKSDGFVHISKMSKRFVNHPSVVVSIGDIIPVTIEKVDLDRNKVELTLLT